MHAPAARPAAVILEGDLTLTTVASLYRELTPRLAGDARAADVDLAATGRIDSAGLALLLEWQAAARSRGNSIMLINVPEDLFRLAQLCEATELLGLGEPDPAWADNGESRP